MLHRLEARQKETTTNAPAAFDTNTLVDEVRSCSLVNETNASRKRLELAEAAEQAWKVLQEEESQMRQAFKAKKPPVAPRSKKNQQSSASSKTAVVAPARRQTDNQQEHHQQQANGSVLKSSINDLWESLAQEEQATVAKVYQKRRSSTKSK